MSRETDELATRVHALAIHLLRRVRATDAASGLTASRLSALSVLTFGGPRTVGELAAAEQVSAPTMSRLVTALEREGLAARSTDPADGRRVRVKATPAGVRALERARRRRVERLAALMEEVEAPQRAVVDEAVEVLEALLARPSRSESES